MRKRGRLRLDNSMLCLIDKAFSQDSDTGDIP